jgi:hypothetical protein
MQLEHVLQLKAIILRRKKIMNLVTPGHIILFCLWIIPVPAFADDFDGSKPLTGTVDKILEIYPSRINDDVDPDTVGLPRNFLIDFRQKIVWPSKDSLVRRTSKIKQIEHIENKLILQGIEGGVENVDDGLAWSIAISKKTGKVVLSASGDGVAYVVFGTCTAFENVEK